MRIAIVVAATGCWTGSEPATPREPPAPPMTVQVSPYYGVAGSWRGVGFQYDTQEEWEISMGLRTAAEVRGQIGTISYPSLGCKARLFREREEDTMLVMTERLYEGVGTCVDGGTIRIPRGVDDELEWRWFYPTGEEGAKSLLRRER